MRGKKKKKRPSSERKKEEGKLNVIDFVMFQKV